jgi:hypothetical protein
MTTEEQKEVHPRTRYPQSSQRPPGTDDKMNPRADHGEESYRGSGKLTGP